MLNYLNECKFVKIFSFLFYKFTYIEIEKIKKQNYKNVLTKALVA